MVNWIAGVHKIRGVSARHRQRKQDVNEQEPVQAGYQAISLRVKLLKLSCRSAAKAKDHRQALRNGKTRKTEQQTDLRLIGASNASLSLRACTRAASMHQLQESLFCE